MTDPFPVVLAFLTGVFVGITVILWLDRDTIGKPTIDDEDPWPRPYPGCDRCMSLRYRATPESLKVHQDRVHARVLHQGPSGW